MNVKQMHIEVRQQLNQIGANRGGKYDQDQIDWVLNKMENRFIRSCLKDKGNGSFEIEELRADDLSSLIVSGTTLNAYIDNGSRYKTFLPPDYQYLLSDGSITKRMCDGATPGSARKILYLNAVKQAVDSLTAPKYYVTNSVTIKGTTVNIPADLPSFNSYEGYNSKDDVMFLVPYIAQKGGWYWEKAAGFTYPGHYIRLSETAGTGQSSVIIGTNEFDQVPETISLNLGVHTNEGSLVDNRLTPSTEVRRLNSGNPFYKSSYFSPLSEIIGNILYTYRDSNFTVSGTVISYIRKSQIISLSLNTSSELSSGACQIVCDLAVEYIKGTLENVQGIQLKTSDIERRVTL